MEYALQEQLNSPTIVQSLTDLLRRAPNHSGTREFEVSLEQLKLHKAIPLDSPFFLKNLCWTAVLSPSTTSITSYDLELHHLNATDVFELDLFYYGRIEVTFEETTDFRLLPRKKEIQDSDGIVILGNCLHEQMFQDVSHLKFHIKLSFTEPPITNASFFEHECTENLAERWRKDGEFRRHWYKNKLLSKEEMALPLHEALAKYLSHLLSEENLKRCCAEDWSEVLFCFMKAVGISRSPATYMSFSRAGILKLIAKLFAADLSQMSSQPVLMALHMLLTDQMHIEPAASDPVVQSQICEALDLAFVNIMPKFSDTRYPLEVLSYFTLCFLPNMACYRFKRLTKETMLHSKMFLTAFDNLEHLLPFLDYQTVLDLAEKRPETLFGDTEGSSFFFDILTQLYVLHFNTNADKVLMTKKAEKMLLETICENYSNPFYPVKERFSSICTLHRTFGEEKTALKDWCRKNSDRKPFLIFPTIMETGLKSVDKIVSMEKDEGFRKQMIDGFGDFFHFLGTCFNSRSSSQPFQEIEENIPIELVKANANDLHRSRNFEEALEMYTCVIVTSETFARRLTKADRVDKEKVFYYVDLANMCHNNRAGSFLENRQPQLALADVVFVINEIQSLFVGEHVYIPGYRPSTSELDNLEKRLVKAKFRRLKLVAALSLWIPALHNSLDLLENHPDRPHETLKYYYHSLLKYSETTKKVQYPPICIMCHATRETRVEKSALNLHRQTKMKCERCRHGYCSEECYRKDTTHKTYCDKLVKLRASKTST